jgi:hypothetical protein
MKVDLAWILVIGGALAFTVWRIGALASRIDRLHHRVDLARASLDTQLLRRARAAEALAASGQLDPASAMVLARAASNCRDADRVDLAERGIVESEMSRDLREVLADPVAVEELRSTYEGRQLVDDLAAACQQVTLARRFHNDGVQAARLLRSGRLVRLFRLAGNAPMPEMLEMDDAIPPALAAHA